MRSLLFISAILSITVLSFAEEPGSDWNLYGSVRMFASYWYRSLWYGTESVWDSVAAEFVDHYVEDTFGLKRVVLDNQYSSRFGVNIKKDKYGFRFELGWGEYTSDVSFFYDFTDPAHPVVFTTTTTKQGLSLRRLYGEWYINEYMSLLVGQEWCLANFFPSAQIFEQEAGMSYAGALYTGREPQIRFTAMYNKNPVLNGKVELAAIKAEMPIIPIGTETEYDAEERMPKLEGGVTAEYNKNMLRIKAQFVGGINRYNVVAARSSPGMAVHGRYPVNTNCLGAALDLSVWKCRLSFAYAQGTNLAAYGASMGNPYGQFDDAEIKFFYPAAELLDINSSHDPETNPYVVRNAFTREGVLVFNVQAFSFLAVEVGAGKVLNKHKAKGGDIVNITGMHKNLRWAWYSNLQFKLLDGHLTLVPEFTFSDLGGGHGSDATAEKGDGKWYEYGCLFQLDM